MTRMNSDEELTVFDRATEKLNLYVPLCLEDNCSDGARKFLQPGGEYVYDNVDRFTQMAEEKAREERK